jgi:hypothetical protein
MPIVPILVGLLFLAGVVTLAMSGKTWRWYHITFGAFTLIFSLVLFYLASKALKVEDAWRSEIAKYEKAILDQEKQHDDILKGGQDPEGKEHESLAQLKTDVLKLQQGRGRMWEHVERRATTPEGVITATVSSPVPAGIEKSTILYVFDDGAAQSGGQFVGQFEVSDVKGQDIQLTPSLKLRPTELARIAQRRAARLVMYEVMPHDDQELYAAMNDAVRVAAFPRTVPAAVRQEFVKDSKPPAANETQTDRIWQRVKAMKNFEVTSGTGNTQEKQMVSEGAVLLLDPISAAEHLAKGDVEPVKDENGNAEKVYVRPLRDYAQLYRDLNLQIESIVRTTAEVDRQTATVQTAQKKVDTDLALRATEKTALESDKTQYLAEEALITRHATALAQRVAEMKDSVKKLVGSNHQLESELSQIYHQAAERINRESAVAASANSQ